MMNNLILSYQSTYQRCLILIVVACTSCSPKAKDFNFIAGTWLRTFQETTHLQAWKVGSDVIEGKQIYITDNDSSLMETFLVSLDHPIRLALIQPNAPDTFFYELESWESNEFKFKALSKNFPMQLVLQGNESGDSLYFAGLGVVNGYNKSYAFEFGKAE